MPSILIGRSRAFSGRADVRRDLLTGTIAAIAPVPPWRHSAAIALLALTMPIIGAQAANTVPSRAFTSEWECDNGRKVLFNAHPLRPKEEAWVTYIGNRAPVAVDAKNPNRYQSQDDKVVWEMRGEAATLVFRDLLAEPLKCKRIKTP